MSSNKSQQAAKAALAQQNANDQAAAASAPRHEGLIGSNVLPTTVTIDGVELSAGDVVKLAFQTAGMGADEWNALGQDDREKRIESALADLHAEAEAEARARKQREASRSVLAARRQTDVSNLPSADQPMATVWDTTARNGEKRTHEIVVGRHPDGSPQVARYALASDTPTVMPLDHAMKFLVDRAFRVVGPDQQIIRPVEKVEGQLANIPLEPDQVIARLDELEVTALLKRAKMLPDSHVLGGNSDKADIVAFIVASRPKPVYGTSRGSEGVQEDPTAGEIVDVRMPNAA